MKTPVIIPNFSKLPIFQVAAALNVFKAQEKSTQPDYLKAVHVLECNLWASDGSRAIAVNAQDFPAIPDGAYTLELTKSSFIFTPCDDFGGINLIDKLPGLLKKALNGKEVGCFKYDKHNTAETSRIIGTLAVAGVWVDYGKFVGLPEGDTVFFQTTPLDAIGIKGDNYQACIMPMRK